MSKSACALPVRSSTRVANPPGGKATFSFGDAPTESPPCSPRIPAVPPPVVVEEVAIPTVVEPEVPEVNVDGLKLQIVDSVLKCNDPELLQKVIEVFPKEDKTPTPEEVEAENAKQLAEAKAQAVAKATDEALSQLKAALKARGTHGIISMGKKFRSMDDDNDKKISYLEFHKAMTELGLNFSEGAKQALFRSFDTDCSGLLSFDEFLTGIKGELNERRQGMVDLAFKVLDTDKDGVITISDIASKYDTSRHPEVMLGSKSKSDVLAEVLDTFEVAGVKDSRVTPGEFSAYYKSISACIDDDDYFELVMRNVWHISGGEGWCQNTTCRRVLVLHQDGTQTVEEITDDMDIAKDDIEAMKANLAARGINAKKLTMYGDLNEASTPATPSPAKSSEPAAAGTPPSQGSSRKSHLRSSIVF